MIDTDSILKTSKEKTATANTEEEDGEKVIVAKITSRVEAKSKVDRQNIALQAAIRPKKGTAAGISKHIGPNVTNSVIFRMDGNAKKVNTW